MKATVVVGLQWGDEGKGKVVDYISDQYDAAVRFNGGANAGHTVVLNGKKTVFHLIPSAALRGKLLFIGPGVAVDPQRLIDEYNEVKPGHLLVDPRATVTTPFDIWLDGKLEELRGSRIGTTGRGIGPTYANRLYRVSPRVCDVAMGKDPDFGPLYSAFGYSGDLNGWSKMYSEFLRQHMGDVSQELLSLYESGKALLFESAQGTLLDPIYGTYPFVTSSNTIAPYVSIGAGFPFNKVDDVVGVMKAYQTRVGAGPFFTELSGPMADRIRARGNEYGSTTGRPRRVGWLDLVSVRYAVRLNGVTRIALMKLDVLSGLERLLVAVRYRYNGKATVDFARSLYEQPEPEYAELDPMPETDWASAIRSGRLPREALGLVELVERETGVKVWLVSAGQERAMSVEM